MHIFFAKLKETKESIPTPSPAVSFLLKKTCYSMSLPSRQQLCNFCPSVSQPLVRLVNYSIFFFCPGGFFNFWIQMVVPPLPALFPDPSFQVFGDDRPALGAIFLHKLYHLQKSTETQPLTSSIKRPGCNHTLLLQ